MNKSTVYSMQLDKKKSKPTRLILLIFVSETEKNLHILLYNKTEKW
jgi:hypothetical protein